VEATLAFEKGHPKYGGRQPGTQNKASVKVKAALLAALEADAEDGGEEFFSGLRVSDPKTFATLVSKLIPTEQKLSSDGDSPLVVVRNYTGKEFED
jgi:hypothetical protein